MAKEEKSSKEKSLEELGAKELRELALAIEGLTGVQVMNKSEMISEIKKARGIAEKPAKKYAVGVRRLKTGISELRAKKLEAKEGGNLKLADSYRRRISNLKKKTRKCA